MDVQAKRVNVQAKSMNIQVKRQDVQAKSMDAQAKRQDGGAFCQEFDSKRIGADSKRVDSAVYFLKKRTFVQKQRYMMNNNDFELCEWQFSNAASLAVNADNIRIWNKVMAKNRQIVDKYYYKF
jgi:hypothetical protein